MMPRKSYDCTGALAGVLLRDRGCVCEGGEWGFCLRASLSGFGFRVADGPGRRGNGERELEAGCGALAALLLAPLGAELGDSHSCDGESALLSASDERAWLRDRGCIGDGSLTVRREAVCRRCGGGGGGRRRRCSLAGGGAVGGDLGADEWRRPRNRVAGDLDLEAQGSGPWRGLQRQPHDLGCMRRGRARAWRFEPHVCSEAT